MDAKVIEFLNSEHVAALTLETAEGLHAAALHFSFSEDPFTLYFSTDKTSRKGSKLSENPIKAALVIGISPEKWQTLQVDGTVRIASESEIPEIKKIHYERNPGSKKFEGDPNTVFLIFTPTWGRFTDFNTNPLTLIEF
jgi:uncharacterized protein YhbP (UPF0306 family)